MSKKLVKYITSICDKVKTLSKKENSSLEDSINSYNKNNKIKLSLSDNVSSLSIKYGLELNDETKLLIEKNIDNIEHIVKVIYTITRMLKDNKPPIKIDKLEIGEIIILTNTLKENIKLL